MKRQLNVRISDLTHRQIDELVDREDLTKGEVVMIAIDRVWRETMAPIGRVNRLLQEVALPAVAVEEGTKLYVAWMRPQFAAHRRNHYYIDVAGMSDDEIKSELTEAYAKHCRIYGGQ